GRRRAGTAGRETAAVADVHETVRQARLAEPAEKFSAIKVRGAEADTAPFPGGAGDRAVLPADETGVGDGALADRRGKGGAGGGAVVMGLPVDMPRDGPDLGSAVL